MSLVGVSALQKRHVWWRLTHVRRQQQRKLGIGTGNGEDSRHTSRINGDEDSDANIIDACLHGRCVQVQSGGPPHVQYGGVSQEGRLGEDYTGEKRVRRHRLQCFLGCSALEVETGGNKADAGAIDSLDATMTSRRATPGR